MVTFEDLDIVFTKDFHRVFHRFVENCLKVKVKL
jgi:hypothetical protein